MTRIMDFTHKKTASHLVKLVAPHRPTKPKETACVKCSKADIHRKYHRLPELRFEDQKLTSYAGLVLFQALFSQLGLREQLNRCFRHLTISPIFGHGLMVMLLIVHLLLGYRRLKDLRYYQDDPLVKRVLGVARLPDVATLSRTLAGMDEQSVAGLRDLNRKLVLDRLRTQVLRRVTLDFDGSVLATGSFAARRELSRQLVLDRLRTQGLRRVTLDCDGSVLATGRFAEGTAVGFNRKKKGQRSYYPLFCTVAQLGQALDVWQRPGNVHDSRDAQAFIHSCIQAVRQALPRCVIEVRMDSAFFSDAIVQILEAERVEFTISVPFERFAALKRMAEGRQRWDRLNAQWTFFESDWKPKSWNRRQRFVFLRQCNRRQYKDPVQLDLFIPYEYGYD